LELSRRPGSLGLLAVLSSKIDYETSHEPSSSSSCLTVFECDFYDPDSMQHLRLEAERERDGRGVTADVTAMRLAAAGATTPSMSSPPPRAAPPAPGSRSVPSPPNGHRDSEGAVLVQSGPQTGQASSRSTRALVQAEYPAGGAPLSAASVGRWERPVAMSCWKASQTGPARRAARGADRCLKGRIQQSRQS
jgi:hypothetical protein